jgi:pilus assembly protein CpaC
VVNGGNQFFAFIEALRQYDMVKTLAEPTLVTVSGRPATFLSGGEFPFLVPQSLGTVTVQYRQYGTRVDFVPLVLGKGAVRLEVRPQITEIDKSTAVNIGGNTVPGLLTRWVDTAVEMKVGQTFALAGLLQQRIESENRGVPWLADMPWVGAFFRRVSENLNEVELLITVTPEFAEAVDPNEMPPCGPGMLTTMPSDKELYCRGYMEVPNKAATGPAGNFAPQAFAQQSYVQPQGYGPPAQGPMQGYGPQGMAQQPGNVPQPMFNPGQQQGMDPQNYQQGPRQNAGWPTGQPTPANPPNDNSVNNGPLRYPAPPPSAPVISAQNAPIPPAPPTIQYAPVDQANMPPQVQVAPVTTPGGQNQPSYNSASYPRVRTGNSATGRPVATGDNSLLGPLGYDPDVK